MARHGLYLLIFTLFLTSCYRRDLPIEIWFDSKFSDDESETIFAAMTAWEDALSDRLGTDIFIFGGWHYDEEFDFEDMGDGRHVIYKIDEPTASSTELEELLAEHWGYNGILGYGLHSDVLIYWYKLIDDDGIRCVLLEDGECDLDPETRESLRDFFYYRFQDLVMHELGHFLGLGHNNTGEVSVMSEDSTTFYPDPLIIQEADIDDICQLYECR